MAANSSRMNKSLLARLYFLIKTTILSYSHPFFQHCRGIIGSSINDVKIKVRNIYSFHKVSCDQCAWWLDPRPGAQPAYTPFHTAPFGGLGEWYAGQHSPFRGCADPPHHSSSPLLESLFHTAKTPIYILVG